MEKDGVRIPTRAPIKDTKMNKREYLFTCLAEEAAEVGHSVGKILRFGFADHYKIDEGTNDIVLGKELSDLIAIVELLTEEGIVIPGFGVAPYTNSCREAIVAKKIKVLKYMEYSKQCGCLEEDS